MQKTISFITGNPNKLKEFTQIMGDVAPYIFDTKNIDLPEYQGEPEEVALEKCKTALELAKSPVLIEDTSLCFNGLKGLPGPYIKWFLEKLKPEGKHQLKNFDSFNGISLCLIIKLFFGYKSLPLKVCQSKKYQLLVRTNGDLINKF